MNAAVEIGKDEGLDITVFDRLQEIAPYNQDFDADGTRPEPVEALKTAIRDADALLVATPEYNYSVPGVLKNAIDWAARPPATSPLREKPAAIMGASSGIGATIRAQLNLRQTFLFSNTYVLLQPEVQIPKANERFDDNANLTDQSTRDLIRRQMHALAEWVQRIQGGTAAA
jgi:chromate reductase